MDGQESPELKYSVPVIVEQMGENTPLQKFFVSKIKFKSSHCKLLSGAPGEEESSEICYWGLTTVVLQALPLPPYQQHSPDFSTVVLGQMQFSTQDGFGR